MRQCGDSRSTWSGFLYMKHCIRESIVTKNSLWKKNSDTGESDLEGGSEGKCFLYCGFGFVYKVIHIPSRTMAVAGDVLRERDNR